MPKITFNAQFVCHLRDVEVELTDQEYADLQSGKKQYYDFLDNSDYDTGEWTEGSYIDLNDDLR